MLGLELQRLFGLGGEGHRAGDDQGGAHVLGGDFLIIVQSGGFHYHLEILEAGTVVELNEAEALQVPDGADPAAHGDGLAGECLTVGEDRRDFRITHDIHPFFLGFGAIPSYCTPFRPTLQEETGFSPGNEAGFVNGGGPGGFYPPAGFRRRPEGFPQGTSGGMLPDCIPT